jgi:Ser/Thr protein kinase RdoA (MazF antagonist)
MSSTDKIIEALRHSQKSLSLQNDFQLFRIQKNVYRLDNGRSSYLVKWVSENDKLGLNEIAVNKNFLGKSKVPAPKLIFILRTSDGYVAGWEWIEGIDLKKENRHLLIGAFEILGNFHRAQRCKVSLYSQYTLKNYKTIKEFLREEVFYHCSSIKNGDKIKSRCISILSVLENGYSTFIHGDFHPGNIRVNNQGFFFLDWAYAHNGLNLMDLDYIQSIPLATKDEKEWWVINPAESETILPAYFKACGLESLNIKKTHHAVMLLTELSAHTNSQKYKNPVATNLARKNIELLLNA